jgi:hypothetical protein
LLDQVLGHLAPLNAQWDERLAPGSQGDLARWVGALAQAASAVSDEDRSAPHLRVFSGHPPDAVRSVAAQEERP